MIKNRLYLIYVIEITYLFRFDQSPCLNQSTTTNQIFIILSSTFYTIAKGPCKNSFSINLQIYLPNCPPFSLNLFGIIEQLRPLHLYYHHTTQLKKKKRLPISPLRPNSDWYSDHDKKRNQLLFGIHLRAKIIHSHAVH